MRLRIFLPQALVPGSVITLPAPAARHVQVLRLQPGATVLLFNGSDEAEWTAEIVRIGRSAVEARVGAAAPVDRELPWAVTLAVGVPANDRMDALVEKAGELGARAIQPLVCERSVLRLSGERAESRRRHWSGVAAAASEQCGRSRVAEILPLQSLAAWLDEGGRDAASRKLVLSLNTAALGAAAACRELVSGAAPRAAIVVLSGPEGGLTGVEEAAALERGFEPVSLGPRVLRADTAPLALLAWLAGEAGSPALRRRC
jgi:16S rRNA (uracil1498-N3)-methyltransferase